MYKLINYIKNGDMNKFCSEFVAIIEKQNKQIENQNKIIENQNQIISEIVKRLNKLEKSDKITKELVIDPLTPKENLSLVDMLKNSSNKNNS